MRLRYLQGSEHLFRFKGEEERYYGGVLFSPDNDFTQDVPERIAERLLNNPTLKGQFKVVDETPPEFICEVCKRPFLRKAALGAHKRIHKEQSQ